MSQTPFQMLFIVRDIALKIIVDLQDNIRTMEPTSYGSMNNTEEALNSLRYKWEGGHMIIYSTMVGWNHILTLDTGRGPGAPPPTKEDNNPILDWLKFRGIQPDDISQESLAYLIARKIGEDGTKVWQEYTKTGKVTGIISDVTGSPEYYRKNILQPMRDELTRVLIKELQIN